jgi:hypothetical protein
MNIDLEEVEQSLIIVYQKNLDFLKKNFFDIYVEVEKFSNDLANNTIEEKYTLELKDGYFDILNLENNGYYYAKNSYTDAENRVKYVDTSLNNSLDLLRKMKGTDKLVSPSNLNAIYPVVDHINEYVNFKELNFKEIMKYVYIGVGLGYHIEEIDKKIKSHLTLIIEPELEIFRLSLFTIDYSKFEEKNRKLFLSIGDERLKIENDFRTFFLSNQYMNYNIKHYVLLKNLDYIRSYLVDFCENNYIGNFPYKALTQNVERTFGFIKNKDKFLIAHEIKTMEKKNILESKEVLLISAGPSLDGYIELIQKYQNKYIVVCVDVIVKKLEKFNIVPDIVFSIDPSPLCAEFLTTEDPEYLKNSIIILLSQQHPDVMTLLKKRSLNYCFNQFSNMIKTVGSMGSIPNVGTFSFHIMVHIGAKKLFTIGNDAAFNQETGARYDSDSSYSAKESLEIEESDEDVISHFDILEVKGNLRDTVKSNRSLLTFRNDYATSINSVKLLSKYKAYNLSDGVYIEGLVPMLKNEFIEFSDNLSEIDIDIISKFDDITTVVELPINKVDLKIFTSIILRTKKFQKEKVLSRNDFMRKKLDLMIWILKQVKELSIDIFGKIFLEYTHLIDSYMNFYINLSQVELYSVKNLTLLKKAWTEGTISVFKDMKKAIT